MVGLEVCVDSILSAANASEAGADRIELCSALSEGGLTPSVGLFLGVKKSLENSKTKIFCMIRIRRGDFNFSDCEVDAMIEDVKFFKREGADGIVLGCLDRHNAIHVEHCQRILSAWDSRRPATFHRAFDETNKEDLQKNIETLLSLGITRILSSGYEASAEAGIDNLKAMVDFSTGKEITIMAGAGVTSKNVTKILAATGVKEVHGSARSELKSSIRSRLSMGGGNQDLQPLLVCDRDKVKELLELIKA